MYPIQKIITGFLISLQLLMIIPGVKAAEDCTLYWTAFQEKLKPAKQEVEEKLNALATKPDTSTPYLTNVGVTYLREYNKKITKICDDIFQQQSECNVITQELIKSEYNTKCLSYVADEVAIQKKTFEKLMIADAGMKKYQFLVNKYQELNKKFRELVALIGFIKGKLNSLLQNVGKAQTKCQAQGSA